MKDSENNSESLNPEVILIHSCLTPKECNLLIKYHKANPSKVTHSDPTTVYNGRRIPSEFINNLEVKRIIAKYQYDVVAEIWEHFHQRCYPEQTEIMRWPIGVPQEIHIDTMGSNKEDEMCVIPFTDYASILYLNDDFDDGLTIFEGGYEIKPQQGMVAIFEGMKYWHEVSACKVKDRYTLPCWYTTEWRNMELQTQGGEGRAGLYRGTLPSSGDSEKDMETLRHWWKETYFPQS